MEKNPKMQYKKELEQFFETESVPNFKDVLNEISVTGQNINSKIKGKKGIVLIYADWCGHCKNFKPKYMELYQIIRNWNANQNVSKKKGIKTGGEYHLFAMDSDGKNNREYIEELGMKGIPSLYFIGNDGKLKEYNGPRDPTTIWIEMQTHYRNH